MAIRMGGEIIQGFGAAASTIKKILPHLKTYIHQLEYCYPGTLNILLDEPIFVRKWDVITKPIHWYDKDPNQNEKFGLLAITISYKDVTKSAWIIDPHGSPHRANPLLVEVLAPELDVAVGDRCILDILHRTSIARCTIVG